MYRATNLLLTAFIYPDVPRRSLPRFVIWVVIEALVVLAAMAGILAFLLPLLGLAWSVALIEFVVLAAIVAAILVYLQGGESVVASALATKPSSKQPLAEMEKQPGSGPAGTQFDYQPALSFSRRRPTILDRFGRYLAEPGLKLRTENDLEGEVNRRCQKIILDGGRAASELMQMLDNLPRRDMDNPVKRGMIVQAVEVAYRMPNPLDVHTFTRKRLERYEKEADERYGFGPN